MININNMEKFSELRKKFPWFKYESFSYKIENQNLNIDFQFNLSGKYLFKPTLEIPVNNEIINNLSGFQGLDNLVFHIGLIELISYWKAACPELVIIEPFYLSDDQINWWKKLYFNGLGEFFFVNQIETSIESFMNIKSGEKKITLCNSAIMEKSLVPVGGGKDSAVTLELLKSANLEINPFIINPRIATLETCQVAGFNESEIFVVKRTIDNTLLQLNNQGFLNGHTPFSALLAFTGLAVAALNQFKYIALSNESSANEPTIPGSEVNHQYSKSYEFESDFREYVSRYIHPDIEYFSFLRPINELQIGRLFSTFPKYFPVFKSCNAGSKNDTWCCKCPKCLFTYIILSPFVDDKTLKEIFEKNLFENSNLIPTLKELIGIRPTKPFECIGTIDDVRTALNLTISAYKGKEMPLLLSFYSRHINYNTSISAEETNQMLYTLSEEHFLNESFLSILEHAIHH